MKNRLWMIAGCLIGVLSAPPIAQGGDPVARKETARKTQQTNGQAIERFLKKEFQKPDAPLAVLALASDGEYGLASWSQDSRAGRALLKKEKGRWSIVLCAGDALIDIDSLRLAGVDQASARRLVDALVLAEAKLSEEQRHRISAFAAPDENPHAGHAH